VGIKKIKGRCLNIFILPLMIFFPILLSFDTYGSLNEGLIFILLVGLPLFSVFILKEYNSIINFFI
jgi:hypothetical protein